MHRRRIPSSLIWLTLLIAAAVAAAGASGVVLYLQTRHAKRVQADAMTGGDWQRGKTAIVRYQCGSCHVIPGVDGATGQVGPDLTGIGTRVIFAGDLANNPAALTRFILCPQRVRPGSAMPELGVGRYEARSIAAYLYAQ